MVVDYRLQGASGNYDDLYNDGATMTVYVKNFKVTAVTFVNRDPTETPPSGDNGSERYTWVPGDVGLINIEQAIGVYLQPSDSILVSVTSVGTQSAKWNVHPFDNSGDYPNGGDPTPSPLVGFFFAVKGEDQIIPLSDYPKERLTIHVSLEKQ